MAVVPVVMVMPVIMVSIIIVPVVGPPWAPVARIISPVPMRPPNYVARPVHIPDYRPGSNIIISGGDHIYFPTICLSRVSGIWCFSINRFHNVIRTIKGLITNQLDLHCTIPELLHDEHSNILLLISVKGCTKDNGVHISIDIIGNRNIIYEVVTIQVQVIDGGFFVIQAPLKSFQGFRFLEQIHHGVEIQVVSRQTQVFIGIVLCRYEGRSC